MTTVMMRASVEMASAQPKGLSVPHRLLVNHNGFGFGFHEHPPKSKREGNDRDD